ncbi:MAG: insulinase family protein [Myxococcota bacterium]|nr:insulinase family protein [Myxococcota bacterium]
MRRLLLSLLAVSITSPVAAKPVPPAAPATKTENPLFAKSGISNWTKPPAPTKEPSFKAPVPKRLKLKNGVALLVVQNRALPILSMTLVVPNAGSAADPAGKGGLAAFATDLLDEGAGGLSALAIAQESDRLGASFGAGVTVDSAQLSVSTLSKTLDDTLALFTKIVTQPAFDDKEAERVKGDRVTSLELRRDRPREVAAIMLNAALYGMQTAYGHPTAGIRDEFKHLGVADARAFYAERWSPAGMTLIVSGDVDPAALKAKLDAGFGAWKPVGAKRAAAPVVTPAKLGPRLLLVDRPAAAQSDVRIGLVGLGRKDGRYFQFEVLRTVLGDGFTSRLTQRLREQLGITYGASASMDWRVARGPFVIGTAIVTPETARGLSEIIKLVDGLSTTDVPAEELEKAKQNIIRALPAQFGTNAQTVGALTDLVIHKLPDNWYASYAAAVRRVTAKDVKAVARTLVPSKNLVFSVVGDLSKVRSDLDKLGLGEPAMHDLYGMPAARTKSP